MGKMAAGECVDSDLNVADETLPGLFETRDNG
jgi:hypothetical protein